MLQTLLLLMKSLNKTDAPIFCNVFFVFKGKLNFLISLIKLSYVINERGITLMS